MPTHDQSGLSKENLLDKNPPNFSSVDFSKQQESAKQSGGLSSRIQDEINRYNIRSHQHLQTEANGYQDSQIFETEKTL